MRKVQLDNSDLLAYFNTIEELKIIHRWRNIELDTVNYVMMMHLHMKLINIDLHILRCADWIRRDNLFWVALLVRA